MPPARLEEGLALHRRGRLAEAADVYRSLIRKSPRHADALHLLGCVELAERRTGAALDLMRRAVAIAPDVPLYRENLAEAHHRAGDREAARAECRRALELDPDRPRAWNRLGVLALEETDYEAAVAHYGEALRRAPADVEALVNLAGAHIRMGQFAPALDACARALTATPGHPPALINLGLILRGLGRGAEAEEAFRAAGPHPMARFNLGYEALRAGRLAEGLSLLEERRRLRPVGQGLAEPEWDGSPRPDARLLLVTEQGLGDTLLMARFVPGLLDRFRSVSVVAPRPLVRLLAAIDSRLRVAESREHLEWDLWCPSMSLPLRLGVREENDLAAGTAWFPREPRSARTGPPGPLRAGLNWAGNPRFAFDRVRSTTLDVVRPLLALPGIEWVSLHKGHREAEARAAGLPAPLVEAGDFLDTARVLSTLDVVVSTETAVPNLSAAMGLPTLVLAAVDHDWRWHGWFPDVVVCAQEAPGDWSGAVARAAAELARRRDARRP